jgi:tetratricopeptide (TPR) repeat protein
VIGSIAAIVALVGALVFILRSGPASTRADANKPRLALPSKIDAILDSARTLSAEGDHAKSEAVLRESTAQYPDVQDLRLAYAQTLLELKKPHEAYEQYVAALSIGPRDPRVEFTAGTAASTIDRLDRALEHYSAAQSADPTNPDYPLYLGQVQAKTGQTDAAKASLLRAAKLDENRAVIWGTLADIALRENNAGLAAQHARRARTLEPANAIYRLIEARALNRLGRPEDALELLVAMPEADRRQPEILRLMGDCYGLLKRPGDAAALYASSSDADPVDSELAFRAGEWFERAGEPDRSREYLERAAKLGHEAAKAVLERLEGSGK